MVPSDAALRAAQAVEMSRNAAQRRVGLTRRARRGRQAQPLSMRQAAIQYGVSKGEIERAKQWLAGNLGPQGRPTYLREYEEDALIAFVHTLKRAGTPASRLDVQHAAWHLRQRRVPDATPPSRGWYRLWRDSHPELLKTTTKAVEVARKAWEASDPAVFEEFFSNLTSVIKDYRIGPSEAWNEDEAGFRIGCLNGRTHCIVTRDSEKQSARPEVIDPNARETCSIIACGNAVGDTVPPWFVLSVYPTEGLADCAVDRNIRFARSDTGFSNAEITNDWLRHFNIWSWKSSAQAQRSGLSLEEWFGCDAHFQVSLGGGNTFEVEGPTAQRAHDDKIYRLLAIDGFSGHISFDLIDYCHSFDIVLCFLPPHSSHRLQPMDVGVFQPLKIAHQRVLRDFVQAGNFSFNRHDFISAINRMIEEGFTRHNIMKGFEESGIYPPSVNKVMPKVVAERARRGFPIEAPWAMFLPHEDRFKRALDSIEAIRNSLAAHLDHDQDNELKFIRSIIAEGAALSRSALEASDSRRKRLEAYANRRKKGAIVKPSGLFVTSVSFGEIEEQFEASGKKAREESLKKELRFLRTLTKQEINRYKEEWKALPSTQVNGRLKKPSYPDWLDASGKAPEVWSLEETIADLTTRITGKPDPFFIDIARHDTAETNAVISHAQTLERPLRDMQRLPQSDDSVVIEINQILRDASRDSEADDYDADDNSSLPSSPPQAAPSSPRLPALPDPPRTRSRARAALAPSKANALFATPAIAPTTKPTRRWKQIQDIIRTPASRDQENLY